MAEFVEELAKNRAIVFQEFGRLIPDVRLDEIKIEVRRGRLDYGPWERQLTVKFRVRDLSRYFRRDKPESFREAACKLAKLWLHFEETEGPAAPY